MVVLVDEGEDWEWLFKGALRSAIGNWMMGDNGCIHTALIKRCQKSSSMPLRKRSRRIRICNKDFRASPTLML